MSVPHAARGGLPIQRLREMADATARIHCGTRKRGGVAGDGVGARRPSGQNPGEKNNEVAGTHNHLHSCFLVGWASLVKCCPVRCLWGWTRKLDFSLPTSVWCKEWSCWIRAIYLTPPSPTCCGVMSVT